MTNCNEFFCLQIATQALNNMPEYLACLRDLGHSADMSAITLREMKTEVAGLVSEEWERRRVEDKSLPARVFRPEEVLELEVLEGVNYVNYWSYTPFNPAPVMAVAGLNEPCFSVNSAADACHVKHGALGTIYLIGYPDANRSNRIRHIEYHAAPECRAGWKSAFKAAMLSEPAMRYHHACESMGEDEQAMPVLPLCVSDGDKGLTEAMLALDVPAFRCTNHRAANVKARHGVEQSELYKALAKAPNAKLFQSSLARMNSKAAGFVHELHPSAWSVCYNPILLEGGSLDGQTTNNIGEQLNKELEDARCAPTPLACLDEVVRFEQRRYVELQAQAHACTEHLPPRVAKDVAKAKQRVLGFKANSIQWLDGNVKMHGKVQRRNDAEASVTCRLVRLGPNRVHVECECKYAQRDGIGCDHGIHLAQQGGKAHVYELIPFRMTTEAWKLQYPLHYFPHMPTDSEMAAAVMGSGKSVREECGIPPSEEATLLPVLAMRRQRGRPSKDSFKRMDPHTAKTNAAQVRPTLDAIGDLVLVNKNKCSKCGQRGHTALKCQGRGFVASLVDKEVTTVYLAKDDANASVGAAQRASGKRPAPPELDVSGDEFSKPMPKPRKSGKSKTRADTPPPSTAAAKAPPTV